MLYIFFLIVFLAELIVMEWIVSKIIRLEKRVIETNQKVINYRPILKERIQKATSLLSGAAICLKSFVTFIAEKRGQCRDLLCKNLMSSLLCMITKIPFKQILTGLEIFLSIKKLLK